MFTPLFVFHALLGYQLFYCLKVQIPYIIHAMTSDWGNPGYITRWRMIKSCAKGNGPLKQPSPVWIMNLPLILSSPQKNDSSDGESPTWVRRISYQEVSPEPLLFFFFFFLSFSKG